LETWRLGDLETWRPGDLETWRPGDLETWRPGDLETWRPGDGVKLVGHAKAAKSWRHCPYRCILPCLLRRPPITPSFLEFTESASQTFPGMVTRKARVLRAKRTWKALRTPPPRDWTDVLSEDELPIELTVEFGMLVRQLWLLYQVDAEVRTRIFPPTIAHHVAQRRTDAISEAPFTIRSSLRVLMKIGRRKPPTTQEIVAASEIIVDWAQDAGFPGIALQIAEAAAAAASFDARANFVAGRTNRMMGDDWRAEIFYGRAIRLAQRQLNWDVYIRANLGCGRLLSGQGRYKRAAERYATAASMAKDQGHRWLAAQTYHDLLALYYEKGKYEIAREYAQLALETYPHHNEHLPRLVHDYGFLLVCIGRSHDAVKLIEPLMEMPIRPHLQVAFAGTFARVMGELGRADSYADGEARVLTLAPHHTEHAPFAFVNLAYGARALGDWHLALQYAKRGAALAEAKNRPLDLKTARRLIRAIRRKTTAAPPAPSLDGEPGRRLDALAAVVNEELAAWREDGWTWKDNQAGTWVLGPV
jgi:tetratricopeptide (TPR) repeat protein